MRLYRGNIDKHTKKDAEKETKNNNKSKRKVSGKKGEKRKISE